MKLLKKYDLYIFSIFIAVSCFIIIYGINILNPTFDDWILVNGMDLTQHYIGWEFYRVSSWQFPFGLMDKIVYPNSVSVIFTDSIPIFAVFFKIISLILPKVFQYFGLWELLCFILQGFFSTKILYAKSKNKIFSCIGSIFFIIAPIFINRVFMHTALSSQWLILAALYLMIMYNDQELDNDKLYILYWMILGLLCGSIHLYYIPLCGIILCGSLLDKIIIEKKYVFSIIIIISYIVSSMFSVYLFGGFSHGHQLDAGGLGQFSFNLNGFINPMGWSKILPTLSAYGEGYIEGFAYLGLGIIILIFIAVVNFLYFFFKVKRSYINCIKYIFIVITSVLISVSHKIALNGNYVIEIPYPNKLISYWGMFRSSGRFIWPAIYILMFFGILTITRIRRGYLKILVLCLMLSLQIYDIGGILIEKGKKFKEKVEYVGILHDENWESLANNKKHIIFVSHVLNNQDILYNVSQYAYLHNMTVNYFYFAHGAVQDKIEESLDKSLQNLEEDTIYIFKLSDSELCKQYSLHFYELDNIIIGLKSEAEKLKDKEIIF